MKLQIPAWASALAATLAISAGAIGVVDGQHETPASRAIHEGAALPPIDRGLRANDPIAPPGALVRSIEGIERANAPDSDLVRGRVIVQFKDSANTQARLAAAGAVNGHLSTPSAYADFDVMGVDPSLDPVAVAATLRARPDVEHAEPSYRLRPLHKPNDQLYSLQWAFPLLDMERAWDINPGASSNIVVAVLDSGVAFKNVSFTYTTGPIDVNGRLDRYSLSVPFAAAPDLLRDGRFVASYDFIWGDRNPVDLDGHGTHVAGTIGQVTNNGLGGAGMAFNVRLMPIKVVRGQWDDVFNAPFFGTSDVLARAIRYAVDNGADVLNMSLGYSAPTSSVVVEQALRYAVERGVFVSIAAGNEFERGNQISQPAAIAPRIDGVVAVSAVGRDLRRAYYSNTGAYIELAAPGGDMRAGGNPGGILQQTVDPDWSQAFPPRFDTFIYRYQDGTSMATPHVAGLAALVIQQGITKPAAIEAAMKAFARDLGPNGRDASFGYGLIQPRETLRGLGLSR